MGFQDRDYVKARKLDYSSTSDKNPAGQTTQHKQPPDLLELFNQKTMPLWLIIAIAAFSMLTGYLLAKL